MIITQQILSILQNFDLVDYVLSIVIWVFIFIWIWSIIFVGKDSAARSESIAFQIVSILVVIFLTPVVGLPLYFLVRPVNYKYDAIPYREALLSNVVICDMCSMINSLDNKYCVWCGKKMHTECKECKHQYNEQWDYCPACWAPNSNFLLEEKK